MSDISYICVRTSTAALYTYYRHNRGMLASVIHDADLPEVQASMRGFAAFHHQIRQDLLEAAEPTLARSKPFAETISHSLSFATWQSLARSFTDSEMVALVMTWLEGIAAKKDGSKGARHS